MLSIVSRSRFPLLRSLLLLLAWTTFAAAFFVVPATADTAPEVHTNRLIDSATPYLLQHAHNPVDWYPWGEEAIGKARKENKLIFVSIGYSTCYWCHVAERTIYSNPAIAALMNQWFVNIKVDREERPDLDASFMLARQVLTSSGGWPNNLFVTPDLKPFFAGSYFPPEDQGDTNGFPAILKLIHEDWEKNPGKIEAIGDKVQAALEKAHEAGGKPANVLKMMPANWLAGEPVWASRAQVLASAILTRFIKPDGLVVTSVADASLVTSAIDLDDHDMPSGTSGAYALLAQLGRTEARYAEAATKMLARMADKIQSAPAAWASLTTYAVLYGQTVQVKTEATLDSAAHVKAAAQGASYADHDEILVTLSIDPGYHLIANPASIDYLIPTAVTVPSAPDAKISYPVGQVFKPKFSPAGISVYEGSVAIRADLPKGSIASAAREPLRVEVQACTAQLCLPPATLITSVSQ